MSQSYSFCHCSINTLSFASLAIDELKLVSYNVYCQDKPALGERYAYLLEIESLLSRLIQIQSVNPPGGETEVARFLKHLFDCVDTLESSLEVFSGMLSTLQVNGEETGQAAEQGYILATDSSCKNILWSNHKDDQ
tara:strand:- start:177 stop:584 length:408 start_codon:yes stop_codon:yes gene_type:complete